MLHVVITLGDVIKDNSYGLSLQIILLPAEF